MVDPHVRVMSVMNADRRAVWAVPRAASSSHTAQRPGRRRRAPAIDGGTSRASGTDKASATIATATPAARLRCATGGLTTAATRAARAQATIRCSREITGFPPEGGEWKNAGIGVRLAMTAHANRLTRGDTSQTPSGSELRVMLRAFDRLAFDVDAMLAAAS